MIHAYHNRPGFALAAAVMALVVVGALVTGSFYAASLGGHVGMNTRAAELAFYTAEYGINSVLGEKDISFYEHRIALGDTALVAGAVDAGGLEAGYSVIVHRVGDRLFLLESTGTVAAGPRHAGATRRVGLMARTPYFRYPRDRALQIQGPLEMIGRAGVSGEDAVPPGWQDCPTGAPVAGVVARDRDDIQIVGVARLYGDPPIVEDATLDSSAVLNFGDMTFAEFATIADRQYAHPAHPTGIGPKVEDGVCDTTRQANWGDPLSGGECGDFFPIIYAGGDLTLETGAGQGILVVEGDLRVAGNFQFAGIVIVKGDLVMTGAGNRFTGTVNVLGRGGTSEIDNAGSTGMSMIRFSSCAIDRAYRSNEKLSRAYAIDRRSWIDLSAAGA